MAIDLAAWAANTWADDTWAADTWAAGTVVVPSTDPVTQISAVSATVVQTRTVADD